MNNKIGIVLISIVIVIFYSLQITLDYYLPNAKENFETWCHYFVINNAGYDAMLFLMALVTFKNTYRGAKALCCFLVIMTGGSFIDKVIFGINQYLYSDIFLTFFAGFISIYLYLKRWKTLEHG